MTSTKEIDIFLARLAQVSAKTLSLGANLYYRTRNELKIKDTGYYEYESLKDPRNIRLLSISPGHNTNALSLTLSEVSLNDSPAFEALSYTWDIDCWWAETLKAERLKESRPLVCNGRRFDVTMNLYHALIEFRRMNRGLPIWADQICINQNNKTEKDVQLSMMSTIYRSATRVIVWLGKMSKIRNAALDLLTSPEAREKLLDQHRSHPEPHVTADRPVPPRAMKRFDDFIQSSRVEENRELHPGFISLLRRGWFSRAWTLQELLLAPDILVMMGPREISISTIVDASESVKEFFAHDRLAATRQSNPRKYRETRNFDRISTLFQMRDSFQRGVKYSFEDYLATIRLRGAKEPRDKVLAGQALIAEDFVSALGLESSPADDLFLAFATKLYQSGTRVFLLSLVGDTIPSVENLPSWVPDLTRPLSPEMSTGLKDGQSSCERFLWMPYKSWAKADGVSTAGITAIMLIPIPPLPMRSSDNEEIEKFGYFLDTLNKIGTKYKPTGELTLDVFWQTLIAGRSKISNQSPNTWAQSFSYYFAYELLQLRALAIGRNIGNTLWWPMPWLIAIHKDATTELEKRVQPFLNLHDKFAEDSNTSNAPNQPLPSLKQTSSDVDRRIWGGKTPAERGVAATFAANVRVQTTQADIIDDARLYKDAFNEVYDGRRIFLSEKGYLGVAPRSSRAGDVICLVAGADVLYVFRPVQGSEDTYTLVGEAYMHGFDGVGEGMEDLVTLKVI